MTLEECLRRQAALDELAPEDFQALLNACEEREFPSGHSFIRQGEHADAIYFTLHGEVDVVVKRPRAAHFAMQRRMGPGEIVGLVALVDGGPRSATCTAHGVLRVGMLRLDGARLLMNSRAPISCAFQFALARQLARDARLLNDALVAAVREHLCH